MQCECCGRGTDVLIEIGAVSPRVSVTGRCCADCCVFILRALEDSREEQPAERAEMVPVQDGQVFVDEDGGEILPQEIRFGMKDIAGRIHYFCMRDLRVIPEYEAFEIYPKGWKKLDAPERTAYSFRTFGSRKTDEELITELLLKLNNALMNPLVEKHVMGAKDRPMETATLRERGAVQIEYREGTVCFRVDGRLFSAQDFADLLETYEGFLLTYQVRDAVTSDIPDLDTYYLPVRITEDLLLEELENLIITVSGGRNFISYRNVNAFDIGFFAIYEKLKLYCQSNLPGAGKLLGMKLIRRLEKLETDDDTFPEYQIALLRDLL